MVTEFTFESFKEYINKYVVGQEENLKLIYAGINAAWRSKSVPAFLLRGPPGTGKTMITKVIADYFNAHYVFVQTTINSTEDELIYKFLPSEKTKSGIRVQYGPLPEALIKSHEKTTILVIDEFDKTRPSADALLLDYLQNARISYRIEKEDIITGDINNLVVFLTSNDNREFTEPLLRRVITINFRLPRPVEVEKLLRRYFDDEKVVRTLITIYIASLSAELTKPVTIQELIQLGHAMLVMPDINFNQLLLSFVVKNSEDLYRLNEALEQLDPKELVEYNNLPDVGSSIINKINDVTITQTQITDQYQQTTVQELLTKIKLPVSSIIKNIDNVEKINDTVDATFNAQINTKTFHEYDAIIKTFNPEPASKPDILGKFRVIMDDTLRLTADKPLTLSEIRQLYDEMDLEAYIEDYVYFAQEYKDIIKIINDYYKELKFTYYTKNLIVAVDKDTNTDRPITIINFEKVKGHLYTTKIYINKVTNSNQYSLIRHLYEYYQITNVAKEILDRIISSRDSIMKGEFFGSELYNNLVNFIEDVKDVYDLRVRIINNITQESIATVRKGSNDKCVTDYTIYTDNEILPKTGTINIEFRYIEVIRDIDTKQNIFERISINNDVLRIVNKYTGDYGILEGLKAFASMSKELNDYAKKLCEKLPEVVKK